MGLLLIKGAQTLASWQVANIQGVRLWENKSTQMYITERFTCQGLLYWKLKFKQDKFLKFFELYTWIKNKF